MVVVMVIISVVAEPVSDRAAVSKHHAERQNHDSKLKMSHVPAPFSQPLVIAIVAP